MRFVSTLLLATSFLLAAPLTAAQENASTIQVTISTSLGDMVFELDGAAAPVTVGNFLRYAKDKHYDGTIFHRVLSDFMAQGGGFDTDLKYVKTRDAIPNEATNGLKNVYGTLAMARLPGPHTATAQFFINCKTNEFLDHRAPNDRQFGYCVFGKIVSGQDVFETLRAVPVERNTQVGNEVAYPTEQVVIRSVKAADAKRADALIAMADEVIEARAAEQRERAAAALGDGINLVAEKGNDISGGETLDSGMWVLDVVKGEGASPGPTERVRVHYTGWLTDGTKFDSSRDRGEPIVFGLNQVISGWTEGVGGMQPGGRRFLVIPSQMAYGESGRPPVIPSKATLVFDVELLEVVK
jgi:FKBP-type peptidyl-prolyl cis-trans isomerase